MRSGWARRGRLRRSLGVRWGERNRERLTALLNVKPGWRGASRRRANGVACFALTRTDTPRHNAGPSVSEERRLLESKAGQDLLHAGFGERPDTFPKRAFSTDEICDTTTALRFGRLLIDVKKSCAERQKLNFTSFAEDLATGLSSELPNDGSRHSRPQAARSWRVARGWSPSAERCPAVRYEGTRSRG